MPQSARRPSHGHPGEASCGRRGYRRCYPEMIDPGFDPPLQVLLSEQASEWL